MDQPDDRLRDLLADRPLTVQLELRLERRARLYADRLNQRLAAQGDTDPYNPGVDEDLANVLMLLVETALDDDERACGLASSHITGHLISLEVADEARPGLLDSSHPKDRQGGELALSLAHRDRAGNRLLRVACAWWPPPG